MKKNTPFFIPFISILFFIVACSKPNTNGNGPQPQSKDVTNITLNPVAVYLKINTTRQLLAVVVPNDATNKKLNWQSSNTAVAKVDTGGLITTLSAGVVQVTATSVSNPSITASATITVLNNYDLYISGNGSGIPLEIDYDVCYWKNGKLFHLPGGFDDGRTGKAIAISGTNTYVAGMTVNSNFWYIPTLWVNGTPIQLTGTGNNYHHYANSVALSGSNVYVGGYLYNTSGSNSYFNASLWKINNGAVTPIPLPTISGMTQSDAYGVATVGTDVYTVGGVMNNSNGYAAFWKNGGIPVLLSPASAWGKAKAITVSGNDIYVVGYEGSPNFGTTQTFRIWKNDATNPVSFGSIASFAFDFTGIAVSGADIYISGYITNANNFRVAQLWKVTGNMVTVTQLSDGTRNAVANAVVVSGNDVFVVGNENYVSNSYVSPKARYWRLYSSTLVETNEFADPEYQLPTEGRSRAYGVAIK